jgi:hypothetical protein
MIIMPRKVGAQIDAGVWCAPTLIRERRWPGPG